MTASDAELVTLGEWDHYLPEEEWAKVVDRAEEIARSRGVIDSVARGLTAPQITAKVVQFPNSPNDKSGTLRRTQLWVIHTAECPLKIGYAESMTEWADGDSYSPRVSWRAFIDPATVALFIPRNEAAWHATWANPISMGYEQSGYARFSRAEWLGPVGLAQISLLAQQLVKDGIPAAAVKRLSNSEVNAVKAGNTTITGLCSHAQINPDTRTDPGAGYPWDVLIDFVKQFHPDFDTEDEDMEFTVTNAQELWTKHAIVKDVRATNPDSAPRVTPSTLLEAAVDTAEAARDGVAALDKKVTDLAAKIGTAEPPVTPERAEAILREEVRGWLATFTIAKGS